MSLARCGRGEEAHALLLPHVADWLLAEALVETSAGLGRDEEIATLLEARIVAGRPCVRCGSSECAGRDPEPFNAVALLAAVRERQGRTDEALEALRTYGSLVVDNRDPLAELLIRHDRVDELRAHAAGEGREEAARHLAELLEAAVTWRARSRSTGGRRSTTPGTRRP
ncbi:hypothetical protein [Streptomyces sp. CS081A]|uniref:hypothetical protein n=1 Tax=Streptomyces sp. CS081A TaxID=2162709 RepID=UPI000D51D2F0|nr:hypothetical protein [Streptomyces sp. CS081A]PVC76538.1 hypothetical protein DBP18_07490 [Streptomyces sp. CS081A]